MIIDKERLLHSIISYIRTRGPNDPLWCILFEEMRKQTEEQIKHGCTRFMIAGR